MRYVLRYAAVVAAAFVSTSCGTADTVGPSETGSAPTLKTLQVAPWRVDCTGVAPQTCLQVRESSAAPWNLLYEDIVGFAFEPGYAYEIRIKEEAIAAPPADASSVRRTLVAVISRVPAPPSLVGPTWRLVSLDGREVLPGRPPTAVFTDDGRVSGSAGCNGYFGRAVVTGARLEVGLLGATLMACTAEGVMEQEGAYLDALGKATAYSVAGAELRLGPAPGRVSLVFRAQ